MSRDLKSKITAALRNAIRQAERGGMTQYEIAKLSGLPRSQLTRILDGRIPRLDTAERICRVINCQMLIVAKKKR